MVCFFPRDEFYPIMLRLSNAGRTFISHIMSGGAAEKTQGLHDGDEIIAVNGTSIHGFDNKDVVGVIKSSGDQISIIVIYNYDGKMKTIIRHGIFESVFRLYYFRLHAHEECFGFSTSHQIYSKY